MEQILTYTVAWVVPAVLGFAVGKATAQNRKNKALEAGVKAILRKEIVDAYEKYVIDGCPLSVERRHELDQEFKHYETLGGNSTAKAMYQEICELDICIIKK